MNKEIETQKRIITIFENELGYKYIGNWHNRKNSNVEENYLKSWLAKRGVSQNLITKALYSFQQQTQNQSLHLYDSNKAVYSMLRYGVTVKPEIGQQSETVWLIDWKNPLNNDFFIAEEVTISGTNNKRPDIVIYVNGIALGILELKRSTVSITEGIRQNLDNQSENFIKQFFSTIQFIIAGNDVEGLAYGTIETKEKYYLKWKEVSETLNPNDIYSLKITKEIRKKAANYHTILDKNVIELLHKERFLELIHDFIVFDQGTKKLCRPNQYFGIKEAQNRIIQKQGGIIWHTQGSGKSLTMVWLTKWLKEYKPVTGEYHNPRILILTDREELDAQIESIFKGVDEDIYRTKNGKDLLEKLNDTTPRLMCSLVFKFRGKESADEEDVDKFITELTQNIPTNFKAKGDMYVFVDECHRTHSGKLHQAMKSFLPNAIFIGFTGTPLLKCDKTLSTKVFGTYIHTYKFNEAVHDKVVLDLRYEARNIEQNITSSEKIDEWFDIKTRGLSDSSKKELQNKWGSLKKIFSSKTRLEKIVLDIMLDMAKRERLINGKGNAILISDSIYNACRYYKLFRDAGLKECAIITSYTPNPSEIKGEQTGEGYTERLERYNIYSNMLAEYFNEPPETAINKIEAFEKDVKDKFIHQPSQMKLLIVVNKLLTGFDAPPATYLYIDKKLQDHGLFQAVCRVNRLDTEDKEYGYIIDYMDLFRSIEKAVKDYTSEAFKEYVKGDIDGLLNDRLEKENERLKNALDQVKALCESVPHPKESIDFMHYFCGNNPPESLKETENQRLDFYKYTSALTRAYASIADELKNMGYTTDEIDKIKKDVKYYEMRKKEIQLASGDYQDLKRFEPAMRLLIDSYIGAEESKVLASFDKSLVELLIDKGIHLIEEFPEEIKKNKRAVAEVIENNIKKKIVEEHDTNPAYYAKMSDLLDKIIQKRNLDTIDYQNYLQELLDFSKQHFSAAQNDPQYPANINTNARRALYDNLDNNQELAIELDNEIRTNRQDDWRNNTQKSRLVKNIIKNVLQKFNITEENKIEETFLLIKNQGEY